MYKPYISVVIPVYNVKEYLERCVFSVVNQKMYDEQLIEVILVDDGSCDGSGDICDNLEREYKNITVIHQKNGGLSSARNAGIRASKGKYIQFLDSDDTLECGALERIIKALNSEPDILICRHNEININTGEKIESGYRLKSEEIEHRSGETLLDYLISGRLYNWYAWLNVVKKSFLINNSFYFVEGRCFEDALWSPMILYSAEYAVYLDEPIYNYYINRSGSITRSVSEKVYADKLNVLEFIDSFCRKKKFSESTHNKMLGNISGIYVSLLADNFLLRKNIRRQYEEILRKYDLCLKHSVQGYKRVLYHLEKVIGLKGISIILYMRAMYVRKKNGYKVGI